MTLQNRVLPTGEIVATPERGTFMGNRGILHDETRRLGTARWQHRNWVICALSFKGRRRKVMQAGRHYTELFFLDEAVALAAGHRPCAECRRAAYLGYRAAFETANGRVANAAAMDRLLHRARVSSRGRAQITHEAPMAGLPDGAFVALDGAAWLVLGDRLRRFTPGGYTDAGPRPGGAATVLTPAPTVAALAAGYRPVLHETVGS